jgi:hypothetical protein
MCELRDEFPYPGDGGGFRPLGVLGDLGDFGDNRPCPFNDRGWRSLVSFERLRFGGGPLRWRREPATLSVDDVPNSPSDSCEIGEIDPSVLVSWGAACFNLPFNSACEGASRLTG